MQWRIIYRLAGMECRYQCEWNSQMTPKQARRIIREMRESLGLGGMVFVIKIEQVES
jgi:hypothetical protein